MSGTLGDGLHQLEDEKNGGFATAARRRRACSKTLRMPVAKPGTRRRVVPEEKQYGADRPLIWIERERARWDSFEDQERNVKIQMATVGRALLDTNVFDGAPELRLIADDKIKAANLATARQRFATALQAPDYPLVQAMRVVVEEIGLPVNAFEIAFLDIRTREFLSAGLSEFQAPK
jgi:hypothetical protein